jgi:hypothetical protein
MTEIAEHGQAYQILGFGAETHKKFDWYPVTPIRPQGE